MKTLTVTEAGRNFSTVVAGLEAEQGDVVLTRNRRAVARLVPEPSSQTALEVFGDLEGTLDDQAADALTNGLARSRRGTVNELRNPWAT